MFEWFNNWCRQGIEPILPKETPEQELKRLEEEFEMRQRAIDDLIKKQKRQIKEREKQIQRDFGVFMAGSGEVRRNRR